MQTAIGPKFYNFPQFPCMKNKKASARIKPRPVRWRCGLINLFFLFNKILQIIFNSFKYANYVHNLNTRIYPNI